MPVVTARCIADLGTAAMSAGLNPLPDLQHKAQSITIRLKVDLRQKTGLVSTGTLLSGNSCIVMGTLESNRIRSLGSCM